MKTSILSARLNETELGDLDQLTQTSGLERSALLRFLIRKGIREMKVDFATKAYVENRVTLSRAAEMAGITQHEFILMMPDKQMNLHYDVEELDEDIRAFAL